MIISLVIASLKSLLPKAILFFFFVFTVLSGVLFAFSPDTISRLSKWSNTVIFPAKDEIWNGKFVGPVLILLGIGMAVVMFSI